MSVIDDLRRLDPKDVGNWPAVIQIGAFAVIFVVVIVLGYFLLIDAQREELNVGVAKEEELKREYLDKKARAVNLDAYKQQLAEIQQSFGAMLKQLPSKSEMEVLITEINQSGVGRGLQFELFKPAAVETRTSEFAELPIELKIVGSYHDLAAFTSDVAQLSRIVTLNNVQISVPAAPGTPGAAGNILLMQAVAKTYRALDPEEAVQIKKAEAEAKKKKQQ
ncbi:type IV pilus inner membrane component PilO [Parachitinimonas caeni]|uniref:Type 4a pilus biogenesis protein PilO n=1 Tax=Parachitinimonas caeni TaxID=3031301 RepID=A0ABT7DSD1_9NEIS|nr:type 4a pilus biogenesis protein PilO [Parachitinimonas caeni]MDK2122972.1 type 4a pilus biogenesis protein PilO [Parachitinimonas caeni]